MWEPQTSCLSLQAVSGFPPTLTGLELVNGICHLSSSLTDEGWCPSLLWKLISACMCLQWSFIWFQKGLESDPHVWWRPHLSAPVRNRRRVGRQSAFPSCHERRGRAEKHRGKSQQALGAIISVFNHVSRDMHENKVENRHQETTFQDKKSSFFFLRKSSFCESWHVDHPEWAHQCPAGVQEQWRPTWQKWRWECHNVTVCPGIYQTLCFIMHQQ